MKEQLSIDIKSNVEKALADERLRRAVQNATESSESSREQIIAEIPYWEELRTKVNKIKAEVINNLDYYLETFEKNCRQNGINIHWAKDAESARKIILNLAKENGVKKVVKSKSLTTEEIRLNPALIEQGIETLETDLGEYIVQLNGEVPSHLIIPALHLSKEDVGKLFSEKLGVSYTNVPEELLKVARKNIRQKFLEADMGISGSNFAIAESGSFVIVENEANAHLTITMPRIHVAVIGIEKLIPNFNSLPYFLKLLAPSATGQKASVYVNFVGGPSRMKYSEGPERFDIVLLDNGRSKVLKDSALRETLQCIRCGACLNACPVYRQIGGHAYGWVYMGPIGAVLAPQFLGTKNASESPYLCTLCGECYNVCPVKINLPEHILTLRAKIVKDKETPSVERVAMKAFAFAGARPWLYNTAAKIPVLLQKIFPEGKSLPLPGYGKERPLPPFDELGFRKRFEKEKKNEK
jgi:L-lactate dehydrogenase complex protein LldF